MPTIFISYRRNDNPLAAMLVYQSLAAKFGKENVYFDIDSVPPGIDFREHIRAAVSKCDALLVIIGHQWLEFDKDGRSRLEDPADFVRLEIEAALQREIPVIPVPVEGAPIPLESELPGEISDLVYRNAREIQSGSSFEGHMHRLVSGISALEPKKPAASDAPAVVQEQQTRSPEVDQSHARPTPKPAETVVEKTIEEEGKKKPGRRTAPRTSELGITHGKWRIRKLLLGPLNHQLDCELGTNGQFTGNLREGLSKGYRPLKGKWSYSSSNRKLSILEVVETRSSVGRLSVGGRLNWHVEITEQKGTDIHGVGSGTQDLMKYEYVLTRID